METHPGGALAHASQLAQQGLDELLAAAAQRRQLLKGKQPQLLCLCSLTGRHSFHCQPLQLPCSLAYGSFTFHIPTLAYLQICIWSSDHFAICVCMILIPLRARASLSPSCADLSGVRLSNQSAIVTSSLSQQSFP